MKIKFILQMVVRNLLFLYQAIIIHKLIVKFYTFNNNNVSKIYYFLTCWNKYLFCQFQRKTLKRINYVHF